MKIRKICVYCGSSPGSGDAYIEAARGLGCTLASRGIGLVFGGASAGLMKVLSESAAAAGGSVTGVIPKFILEKVGRTELDELHVVDTMHERKHKMFELADGFVALPGGYGTLDEIIEVLTWGMLGFHAKPCALLNVNGYYDKLTDFFEHAVEQRFISRVHKDMFIVEPDAERILERFESYVPPHSDKWLDRDRV